jgi:hypothetical protein
MFFMELSYSHDLNKRLVKLTRVDTNIFLIDFFNVIIQDQVYWKLNLIIYFILI